MTTTKTQITNWCVAEVGTAGRFVEIKDQHETYVAAMPDVNKGGDPYDLADAISNFSSTYDTNGSVACTARLYINGEVTECEQFEIEGAA
jgi:uncharacterized lipoprotein YmbA